MFNSAGTERVLSLKANYLVQQGYEVVFVTTEQNGRSNYFKLDERIRQIDLDLNYDIDQNVNIVRQVLNFREKTKRYKKMLKQIVEEEKPDIIISTMGKEMGLLPKLGLKCKTVIELHSSRNFKYFHKKSHHNGILWDWFGKLLVWQMVRDTQGYDALVCLTKEDKEDWMKTNKNVHQIYNPLSYDSEKTASLKDKCMIAVGRLDQEKNFDQMIEAWNMVHTKFPDWKLNIWGEGYYRETLQQLIDSKGLSGVINLGGNNNHLQDEYLKSSGCIMTSRYEGLPMVLLEAASCGLPLITYDFKCGPKDIIENGKNGYIVKQNDVEGLAEAICKVICNDELRLTMGKAAKNKSEIFAQKNILPLWPKFFDSLFA